MLCKLFLFQNLGKPPKYQVRTTCFSNFIETISTFGNFNRVVSSNVRQKPGLQNFSCCQKQQKIGKYDFTQCGNEYVEILMQHDIIWKDRERETKKLPILQYVALCFT